MSKPQEATDSALRRAALTTPLLCAERELELVCRIQNGDGEALDALLRAHLRLVFSIAGSYVRFGFAMDDLVSEGLIGLVEAGRRFDPGRGPRFAAYASMWIRARLGRYTVSYRRVVRMPTTRNARKVLARLRRTRQQLTRADGSAPSQEEIARAIGVETSDVEEVQTALAARDVACGAGQDHEPGIELASPALSPEELCEQASERTALQRRFGQILAGLTDRERSVLLRRSLSGDELKLSDVGREMGLTGERVRQIERGAHEKLRLAWSAISA